jgi:hypothetical protein
LIAEAFDELLGNSLIRLDDIGIGQVWHGSLLCRVL